MKPAQPVSKIFMGWDQRSWCRKEQANRGRGKVDRCQESEGFTRSWSFGSWRKASRYGQPMAEVLTCILAGFLVC